MSDYAVPARCHVCNANAQAAGCLTRQNRKGKPAIWACNTHRDRIKCAIDGCKRTRAGEPGQEWLCPAHWRQFCPPRSLRRRAYNGFFRTAKQRGPDPELSRRFYRFWDMLIASARAKSERHHSDMDAINRLFGWNE